MTNYPTQLDDRIPEMLADLKRRIAILEKQAAGSAASGVVSVNGLSGTVTLGAADVSALAVANNLSDVNSAATSRTNLGLGGAAVLNVGTTAGTVAAGDDSRIAGAPVHIGTTVLGSPASVITVGSIPSGFSKLVARFTARCDAGSAGQFFGVYFNGDTGNNYSWSAGYNNGSSTVAANGGGATDRTHIGILTGSGDTANYFGTGEFIVAEPGAAIFKAIAAFFGCQVTASSGLNGTSGGIWASTAAVTSVTLRAPGSSNFVTGCSLSLYGVV